MRKVFLEKLPRKYGKGANKDKLVIDWKNSIGYKVKFVYDDIEGEIEILDYNSKSQKLTIKYNNKIKPITSGCFVKCSLGDILVKITSDFKIEIGTIFKDEKRDITIIDRKIEEVKKENKKYKKGYTILKRKWYKYKCNKDFNEDWVEESLLLRGKGCSKCAGRYTDNMWNTHRELCEQLGVPKEIAETVTAGSNKPITFNCKCGNEVTINPNKITTYKSIGCKKCSDRSSYPEKFMFNVLTQLEINFIWQLTKGTFKWCDKYRYDFYFEYNNEKYIIETNGKQHYKECSRGRSLEEEQENDKLKYELAIQNGINPENYIVIDCRYSELDFIKQNILDSRLNEIFDLSYMDWNECEKFALKNIIKEVCDYWEKHKINNIYDITTVDLSRIFNLNRHTIREYLKKGVEFGWCKYDPKEEEIKRINKTSKTNRLKLSKPILMYDKEMNFIGEYESGSWLEKNSINLFGIKLFSGHISRVARGEKPQYKGYIFKYK